MVVANGNTLQMVGVGITSHIQKETEEDLQNRKSSATQASSRSSNWASRKSRSSYAITYVVSDT